MYIDGTIRNYLADLAARKPAPGGGSAAALSAAIGCSLMSMVANYTIGNAKYEDVSLRVSSMLEKAEAARRRLEALIDEDVKAYSTLSTAMKEFKKGSSELEDSFKEALQPPFEVCRIASECLRLCKDLAECGNKYLITDAAIAAILFEGAFFSAKFNVYINLKDIRDTEFIGQIHKVLAPLEEEIPALKTDILEACEDAL
ncbi:MAG: cyclodeaminase/cyclohydrolase family protein [Candidatus Omnitrophica bacterium]|nr:cyclodeaminase/cyclohydrolase family protein [Candidatus Omnitrophota bacterium]